MFSSAALRSGALGAASLLLLGTVSAGLHAAPRIEQNAIVLDTPFAFVGETADLDSSSDAAARQLAEFPAAKAYLSRVRIEGHVAATDRGADAAQQLSEVRARAAKPRN